MKKLYTIIGVSLFLYFQSCKKDILPCDPCDVASDCYVGVATANVVSDTCFDYPPPHDYIDQFNWPSYSMPYINPSDQNEVLVVKSVEDQFGRGESSFWKYNLCTNEKEMVIEVPTPSIFSGFGRPNWGENGWIVFADGFQNLWKVQDNGDNLTLLIDSFKCSYPTWIGENIICQAEFTDNPVTPLTLLLADNGTILDTLPLMTQFSVKGDLITGVVEKWTPGRNEIGYFNLQDEEFQSLAEFTGLRITSTNWLDENHIIWYVNLEGIFKGNINTGEVTQIKEVCDNISYGFISSCPVNINRIIMNKEEVSSQDNFTYESSSNIVAFDILTGEEWLLELQ